MHAADGGKDIARRAAELCGGALRFYLLLHGIARSNSGCSFLCSAPRPSLTGDIFIVQHADHLFNQIDVFELRKAHDEIPRYCISFRMIP